jgi:hypothetical protein
MSLTHWDGGYVLQRQKRGIAKPESSRAQPQTLFGNRLIQQRVFAGPLRGFAGLRGFGGLRLWGLLLEAKNSSLL